jgi:hypothetical protein
MIIFNILFGILAGSVIKSESESDVMKKYKWKKRPILIFAPSQEDSAYQALKKDISKLEAEIIDRDIVVLHLFEDGSGWAANAKLDSSMVGELRDKYDISNNDITVILIGKDGGEKIRQQGTFDLEEIFRRIDAMPMRRSEMRNRSENKNE